jgi:hypothetical protein
MPRRNLLDPLDPDRIIDMAQLVDGVGRGGKGEREVFHRGTIAIPSRKREG